MSPANAANAGFFISVVYHLVIRHNRKSHHILSICVLLVMPSNMQTLSMGMYCLVMILMTSCATMPPVKDEILWSSPPLARATSSAASTTRGVAEAAG